MILFNYCTYGYSFAHWAENDFDKYFSKLNKLFTLYPQEYGVTMLVLPGIEAVWFNVLTKYYNYTEKEAEEFLSGPCYMPWFLMCNLYNTGGPISYHWIQRQEHLGQHIMSKLKQFGWKAMLPGWNGMVPNNFADKVIGAKIYSNGTWCGFERPYMLDPTSDLYKEFASNYYKELEAVFGVPGEKQYYSIDLFHEGGSVPEGVDAATAWKNTFDVLNEYNNDAIQVVQAWQWKDSQKIVLDNITKWRLIVQDMQSDISPCFSTYKGHNAAFGVIPNFGGRTGVYSRVLKTVDSYNTYKKYFTETSFIPEGITLDFTSWNNIELYTLAVLGSGVVVTKPQEIFNYIFDIYKEFGVKFSKDTVAKDMCYLPVVSTSSVQGPIEAIVCACPRLDQYQVSTWSTAFPENTISEALYRSILNIDQPDVWLSNNMGCFTMMKEEVVGGLNIVAYKLLRKIKTEFELNGIMNNWKTYINQFYDLILDIETLQSLDSNTDFTTLVNSFFNIVETDYNEIDELVKSSEKDWLFRNNLKRQVTLWYDKSAAENGLGNYAYREYSGILSDFYLKRWKTYFETIETKGINWANSNIDWVQFAEDWINVKTWSWENKYANTSTDKKLSILYNIINKYFIISFNEDGSVKSVDCPIASDISGDNIPDVNNADQDIVNEYKQYIRNISVQLIDTETKDSYSTISTSLNLSDVNWYTAGSITNKLVEPRNVSFKFSITGDTSTSTSGLAICCLFVYIKENKSGSIVASGHWGTKNTSDNGFLNDFTDSVTFTMEPNTDYSVYIRVESSWSDNINSETGELIDYNYNITRPSAFISIYKTDKSESEDDSWSKSGTLSNAFFQATGCKVSLGKLAASCITEKDKKQAYEWLMWHLGRITSCELASKILHSFHTGKYNKDNTDSYLVTEIKKLFGIN